MDITIHRLPTHIKISVYRKPTHTDSIIPYHSNHPTQHKYAASKYLFHRLNNYQLQTPEYQQEERIIHTILHNNQFPPYNHKVLYTKTQDNDKHTTQTHKTWCNITYTGKESLQIAKILRKANLNIAYKTNNTIRNLLTNHRTTTDIFTQAGVYKLTCQGCNKAYIGQTGRNFHTRYKEHTRDYKYNTRKSKFATHLLDHNHPIGNIQNTMTILYTHKKGIHLNTIERFHIHAETLRSNQLNEDYADTTNPIFNTILQLHNQTPPPPTQKKTQKKQLKKKAK